MFTVFGNDKHYFDFFLISVHFRVVPILPNLMPKYGSMTIYVHVSKDIYSLYILIFIIPTKSSSMLP